ncbi:MAG: TonB-dependent receptor plug domain-containing protein, partial [Prevotella sp.]|nr:TonB-dependent receptor plug domain-containing protein [Prevotella sp.]
FSLPDNSLKRVLYIEYDEGNYYFSKYIPIPFPKEDYALSFFPEGGNLVEGKPCKIAFKAIKNNGLADNVKGEIVDNTGAMVIPSFESLYKGMGHFTLTPKAGKTYYALVRNDKGIERKVELPAAAKGASSLSVTVNKNRFRLSINHSVDRQASDTLFLIVHSRGVVAYAEPWSPSVRYIDLKQEDFPSGVLQALLLDKNVNPLSERLLFCTNENDQAALSFKPDKESFKAREHLSVDLHLSDKNNTPLEGNFSVSVTNNEVAIDTTSNILTSLLLTSDLKGYIENPAFYFEKNNSLAIEALDNLMLTQGWRRYNIPKIIRGNLEESTGFIELGQEISGVVKGLIRTKGVANAKVNIISMKNLYFNEVATDENGGFAFTGLNFPDNTEFILQAHSAKGSDRVKLITNEDEFPPVESGYVHIPIVKQDAAEPEEEMLYRAGEEFINGIRLIRLKDIEVSATRKKKEQPDAFQRMADRSYDTKWFEEHMVSSLVDVLYHTAGVRVDVVNRKVIVRSPSSIHYGETGAAFAINGLILESDEGNRDSNGLPYELSMLNINDIERVDIFSSGSSVIWGSRGGSGVISITTKSGQSDPDRYINQFNVNRIRPLGYFIPTEFYSPVYKAEEQQTSGLLDYRTTLFWKPNIDTNKNGAASFDFYASDKPTTYMVVIEGITRDGHIIYKRTQIKNMQ